MWWYWQSFRRSSLGRDSCRCLRCHGGGRGPSPGRRTTSQVRVACGGNWTWVCGAKNDKWSLHWDVVWRGWGGKLVISHLQEGAITLSTMMRFKQMLGQSRDGLLDDDCSDQIRTMLAGCNQNHHRCLIDSRGLVWERRINHTLVENYRLDKAEIFSWSSSYGLVMSEPLIWNWPFQIRIQLMFFFAFLDSLFQRHIFWPQMLPTQNFAPRPDLILNP